VSRRGRLQNGSFWPNSVDWTLLMMTHEMYFARKVSDRVVFIYQGLIHEVGGPDTLFANPQTPELQHFL
jgi:polar amino acid transport system ATP-binding protein